MAKIVQVTVFHAADCHLCERALAQVRALRDELGFGLDEEQYVVGASSIVFGRGNPGAG